MNTDPLDNAISTAQGHCNPTKIMPANFWNKARAEECKSIDPKSLQIKVTAAA